METANEPKNEMKFDFSKLSVNNFIEQFQTEQLLTRIPIRSPKKDEFFRVKPDFHYDTMVLETGGTEKNIEKEIYIVVPNLCAPLYEKNLVKLQRFYLLTSWTSSIFYLSGVGLPMKDGRTNTWNTSKLAAFERAKSEWIQLVSKKALGEYVIFKALSPIPDPNWEKVPGKEKVLELAFQDHVITDINHPVLKMLRGEV